ncbi:glycosyl hydrolase family 18 protein [Vitiosangium sp. GDMCC 1.1324]|uniref:glycosyl hydrolase family 18 protein n=1 Tax=Vitiosangium sp. (strain GDMCC 1.1324) TaxID=2138576 RepID=UPI000D3D5F9F|nr:glycosyl hydrolase family 18 protein [Vitiosangium sp. GDMCC 1.1324]PTL76362.1 glycosyl hydrolase [Vitiosangium sp. GDMCC 1.1324]
MRRNKWAVGLIVSALSVGCGQEVVSPEAGGPGSVMQAPLEAAWAPNTAYAVGARVSYNGRIYQCLQAHTSLVGWEPSAVPALWQDLGPATGGDTVAPTVNVSANATSFTAAGTLSLTATATDNVGVTKVEILENGTLVSSSTSYSRSFTGSSQNGTYTYTVKAYDAAGNVGTKTLSVSVNIPGSGDVVAPTVTASANATQFTAAGTLNLTATATDNVGVTKVEILENGTLVSSTTSYSKSFSSSAQNGTYTYTVKAYDAAGNVGSQTVTVTVQIGGTPPPASKRIVAYFTAWGIYGRNYQVSNVPAGKLTHINYAFSNVTSDGKCVLGDSYADIDKAGGWAGEWDAGQLRGNFRAFKELKKSYPNLKLLISVGGWTWSKYFSTAAATAASRSAFVKSCVDLYIKGQFPGVDAANGAGVFDGIDIDWEYPTGGGLDGNTSSPADKQNYTLLMQEFRNQLNAVTASTGKSYLLTIASGASPDLLANKQETKNLSGILDWINVMSYDYHGAFESSTNFQSALYRVTGDPVASSGFYSDGSVAKMLELGVPANKIVLGVPFYGRGWGSVPNVNNGLFQSGVPTKGTWDDGASGLTGVFDYKDLKKNYEGVNGYTKYFHAEAKEAYVYNPNTKIWIAYDDSQSMTAKADYILTNGLGGAMAWELSSDDGSLLDTLYQKLK